MTKYILLSAALFASVHAHGADKGSAAATSTLTRAIMCEVKNIKATAVVKAAKKLGTPRSNDPTDYTLASPITVFGLQVNRVSITPDDGENPASYVAVFSNAKLADIASAAKLKPLAGGFIRDAEAGRISADVRDSTDVWITCTPSLE